MANRVGGRRPRQGAREELARLHVRGVSNKAIAKRLGCVEQTISGWLKEPAVQKLIADLGADANREVKLILERAGPEMARTLVKCARGQGGKNAAVRGRFAESILDRTGFGKSEKLDHTVQGNAGAAAIALAIARRRRRAKDGG